MLNICPDTDHRKHPRHKVFKEGRIIPSGSDGFVQVTVRNLSVGGALVQIPETIDLPEDFSLLVASEEMLYPAEAKWRTGELMGLAFTGGPSHVTVSKFSLERA